MGLNRKYREKRKYVKERTGSVAKWMGLSDEGVRMYERYGLLHSDKDERNHYRTFDIMDMTMLLYGQVYCESGFSLKETQKLTNGCTLGEIYKAYQDKYETQCKSLERELLRLRRVRQMVEDIGKIESMYGQCSVEIRPAMYRIEFMKKTQTFGGKGRQSCVNRWMKEYLPFAMLSTRYYQTTFEYPQEQMDASSGLGIYAEYAEMLGICENEYITYHPPVQSVHTILSATNEVLTPDVSTCLEYIQANHLKICGDTISFGIVNTHFNEEFRRYYHIWVPVR